MVLIKSQFVRCKLFITVDFGFDAQIFPAKAFQKSAQVNEKLSKGEIHSILS